MPFTRVAVVVTLALVASGLPNPDVPHTAPVSTIAAATPSASPCMPAPHCAPLSSRQAFIDFFSYVMSIPESVLRQGDAVTNEWVRQHPRNNGARTFMRPRPTAADPLGCTIAVGAILGGVLVPAAKLLNLRKYIKSLGGIYEAAKLLVVVGDAGPKMEAVAIALGALVAELSGIKGVRDNCFN